MDRAEMAIAMRVRIRTGEFEYSEKLLTTNSFSPLLFLLSVAMATVPVCPPEVVMDDSKSSGYAHHF
jgi:hypothetical protein